MIIILPSNVVAGCIVHHKTGIDYAPNVNVRPT